MKIPRPKSANADLLRRIIAHGSKILSEENLDHYLHLTTKGSLPKALVEAAVQEILPQKEEVLEGDMAAFLALEEILDELNAEEYDYGTPTAMRYESPLMEALENTTAELKLLCWFEITRSDGWDYIEELRISPGTPVTEKTSIFLERGSEKVPIEEVDDKICQSLLALIQVWIIKLQEHLRTSVPLEKWAEAYELPEAHENADQLKTRLKEVLGWTL